MLFDESFLHTLEYLNVAARKILAGEKAAERETLRRGGSIEFRDYRSYSVGDELRYVDWNVYARHGHLFVKEFMAEQDVHVLLLLDASASMDFGRARKFDAARRLAAAIGYVALGNFDSLTVIPFSGGPQAGLRDLRGKSAVFQLLRYLEPLATSGVTDLRAASRAPLRKHRGRTVAIVMSDFLDLEGYAEGLKGLLAQRLQLQAVHVIDELEWSPEEGGAIRLVDAETRGTRDVEATADLVAAYKTTFHGFLDEVQGFCRGHEIPYARVATAAPLEKAVIELLQKGLLSRR